MNIIFDGVSYEFKKVIDEESFVQYDVFKGDVLQGHITKRGIEILFTATDALGNIKGMGKTLREALASMVMNIYYRFTFKGDKRIITLGKWIEGEKLNVEYAKDNIVKHGERVVKYDKAAGDLYITVDNAKYFFHEFE